MYVYDSRGDDDENLVMFWLIVWKKERSKRSKWMTHLKWTVLPNWEMKSNDAKGDDK
jgi:hypothetical protein